MYKKYFFSGREKFFVDNFFWVILFFISWTIRSYTTNSSKTGQSSGITNVTYVGLCGSTSTSPAILLLHMFTFLAKVVSSGPRQ